MKAYKDRNGRQLFTLKLKDRADACDGPDDDLYPQSFVISNGIKYIGAGLTLVDAGDYDLDGHSELVFWYSGYNKDGYVLFSPDLIREADYLWNYH